MLDPDLDQLKNWANLNTWLDSTYQRTPKNSIFVQIKQSLILDPLDLNVDQFENGTKNLKSKYTVRFGISKNPNNSIFYEI